MSNPLSVRRIKAVEIDASGKETEKPLFGVIASDNKETEIALCWETQAALERAIEDEPSILAVVDPDGRIFGSVNHEVIGHDNYYGKDWC